MNQQEAFFIWLSSVVPQSRLSDYYIVIADVESYAKKKKLIPGSIFDITDPAVIQKISNALDADRFFRLLHKKQMKSITESCDYLKRFLKENSNRLKDVSISSTGKTTNEGSEPQTREIIHPAIQSEASELKSSGSDSLSTAALDSNMSEDASGIHVVDFLSSTDYSFAKPIRVSYFGDEHFEASWKTLYIRISKLLYEDYPHIFAEQVEHHGSNPKGKLIYSEAELNQMRVPALVEHGIYIETNRSATEIVKNIKRLLDLCGVDYENLIIYYSRPNEEPMPTDALQNTDEQDSSVKPVEQELAAEDAAIAFLQEKNIDYLDYRNRSGCLWVIGGNELENTLKELVSFGMHFRFKPGGGNLTNGQDAWWTKDYANQIYDSTLDGTMTAQQSQSEVDGQRDVISKDAASGKKAAAPELEISEVDELLHDERFAQLRESLSRNGIRTIGDLKAIKLWPFMNRHDLYSIGMRQTILEQVNALLYPKPELDDSQLFVLRVGDVSYKGPNPSAAFLRFCDSFSTRFPLQFRLLVGAKIRDGTTVPIKKSEDEEQCLKLTNVTAYISESLSRADVVRYAGWICGKCGEVPIEISASEPTVHIYPERDQEEIRTDIQTDNLATVEEHEHVDQVESAVPSETYSIPEPETVIDNTPETDEEPIQEQAPIPETVSPTQTATDRGLDPLLSDIEREVLKADIDGTSYEDVKNSFGLTMLATRQAIEAAPHVVDINGRLIHEEAFIDWEDGATQLEEILDKLMHKNDGYVSSSQLYEYAKTEMTMFLNDNDINEERAVYDMAQHLFGKVQFHGKQYKFAGKMHISNPKDDISSNLDVYRKYAADQGGVFSFPALVEYLGRIGMGTGNLRMQMRVYSEPIFLYYENGIFMYADFMNIDSAWKSSMKKALNELLTEANGHIILRELPEEWLAQLPLLPQGLPWTPLLLQSVLRWYSEELGARTISAMDGQAVDTLHTMLVTLDSPIQSFGDVVITWLVETENEQRDFEAEELRRNLVEAGIIQGNELIWNMPKALKQDERFAWDASGAHVRVEVK